jgi:hypothetical protein
MTALAQERLSSVEAWKFKQFPLAVGNKGYKGGIACLDQSTGKCEPGHSESDLLVIGKFAETVDATAAEALINVEFPREIWVQWWVNAASSIAASDVGNLCFVLDDQSVTLTAAGNSVAGRIWAVDAARGVAVEMLQAPSSASGSGEPIDVLPAFVAAASLSPVSPVNGTLYDVPTTAAASVISLTATAKPGTVLYFSADGTKNGHTVQYKDATGAVALTTALTASKRHMVVAVMLGGIWVANAYVSP